MSDGTLTTYAELAHVVDNLGLLLREARRARALSLRAAAREIGVSFSTVLRAEDGHGVNSDNLAMILRWLDGPR